MLIQPNSIIRVIKNVPLDMKYNNTIKFTSITEQINYFSSKIKFTFSEQSYQRSNIGFIRLEKKTEDLYDCNYLMFQNTSFGTKWFYAFITSITYINNNVVEIGYVIDVMQTWLFNFTLLPSFVEREHSETDDVGDNILPEPVSLGEYKYSKHCKLTNDLDTRAVIIAIADVDNEEVVSGQTYDGVFSGCTLYGYDENSGTLVSDIKAKLSEYSQKPNSIVGIYTCPRAFISGWNDSHEIIGGSTGFEREYTSDIISSLGLTRLEDFDGYVPKNKKLYTYPYNMLRVDNNEGQSLALRYEFFNESTPVLRLDCAMTSPVKAVLKPKNYKNMGETHSGYQTEALDTHESITLENFPICSWSYNAFNTWLQQNLVPILIKGGTSIATAGINFNAMVNFTNANRELAKIDAIANKGRLTNNITGTSNLPNLLNQIDRKYDARIDEQIALNGSSLLSQTTGILSEVYSASIQADEIKGSLTSSNVNYAHRQKTFYTSRQHITAQYAQVIDDFFDKYGYATKRLKVPNISSRPNWNYVKTIGCNLKGEAPSFDLEMIRNIFDNGITFWHTTDVGNYALDNRIGV